MSLLREIQFSAVDSSAPLTDLLRKCKILGTRLGHPEFKEWIEHEINGYKSGVILPDYRILHVNSKGNFVGPFGAKLTNGEIPMLAIPEEFRENMSRSRMGHSVGELESYVRNALIAKVDVINEPWNPNFTASYGRDIYLDLTCIQAWKVIPTSSIVGALEAVRNRVLGFALEIESQAPDAGEAPINSTPIPQDKVTHIYNNIIHGTVHNFASGSTNVNQKVEALGNEILFREMITALSEVRADKVLVDKLAVIIEEMRQSRDKTSLKEGYLSFMAALSDHFQVFGPALAKYLPSLAALVC